ncbi:MAG: 6-phosphogluconolactonase [Anaerolineales bacterium]|nr:6-phosphogluconolactonase [Anaerolineae bacterium]PWB54659.1 MAG: 6-phosphogluconolactonase [Anaerolineales bacterium]
MIRVFNDLEALSQAAAELFMLQSRQASLICGRFCVALSGGDTPRRLFEILAMPPYRDRIHWSEVHVFWSDERCVPADDPRNNALMARMALLDHVSIPPENLHPIHCDLSPHQAALDYEAELRKFFSTSNPDFHLIFLGLGANGHIASLFPHTSVLDEKERWVSEVYIEELGMYRVTFTAPYINQASQVVFLVSGADKAQVLEDVLEGPYQPNQLPAQLIRPAGKHPIWLVDKTASHKLTMREEQV